MEFIKKHGIKILIALLVIFGMNKCTVSCNRGNEIEKQKIEIVQKDSIIKVQSDSLNILKIRWNDAQTSQSTYQGIALDTKQELSNQVSQLTNENNNLNQKINVLTSENNKLKNENQQLKQQINK